jgi:DNA invertase Pin-like site-specific DNA recombinase
MNDAKGAVTLSRSPSRRLQNSFAATRGWTVVAEFEDDGISGAAFERRPGFQAMLAAARRGQSHYLVVAVRRR